MERPVDLGAVSTVVACGETQLSAISAADSATADTELPATADTELPVTADSELPSNARGSTGGADRASSQRYAPLGALGRGGMGVVDRVWDGDLMRELAVKRMRPELLDNRRMVAQFLWEARVGAYLDHPNIVPVHDLGTSPDAGPYFTMKRARGASLRQVIDELRAGNADAREKFPLARRLRAMHQVCSAIAFAHRRGVIHRDLKPANVLVGDSGEVLVMDWGLAIPVPGEAGDHLRTVMPDGLVELSAGTPLYMSPEQARGEPLDERSDVFTLGVMLYEIASLERPFAGSGAPGERATTGTPRSLREVCPGAPRTLAAVIEHAMAPDPAGRYESVAALAYDIERVMDGLTPKVERASALTRAARFYMSRDRTLSQMRVVDVDAMFVAAMSGGFWIGAMVAGADWIAWPLISLAVAVVTTVVVVQRYLALRRSDAMR